MKTMETYTSKSLQTFNGHVTIYNPETGGHRTFEIKTGAVDSWAKGRRFISLKTGPNYGDNTAFAFIWMDGTVKLFKKFEFSSEYHTYLRMLQIPEQYMARGLEYKFETTCRKCNRPLTVPSSIDRGLGPVCAGEATDKPAPKPGDAHRRPIYKTHRAW